MHVVYSPLLSSIYTWKHGNCKAVECSSPLLSPVFPFLTLCSFSCSFRCSHPPHIAQTTKIFFTSEGAKESPVLGQITHTAPDSSTDNKFSLMAR